MGPPEPKPVAPGLYLVATPIGNLRDITLRAVDVLAAADLVLAEDTRVTGKLLAAHGISARLQRYDDHAGAKVRPKILADLAAGARVALVSDAGTPLVSDPGYRLVIEAIAQGAAVYPIPGPSAALAALTVAGLPTDRFLFAGFPPVKAAARRAFLDELAPLRATLIFYEGGSRLADSLKTMAEAFGPRPAAVARELTKLHETVVRAPLDQLVGDPRLAAPKGEIVILVGGAHDEAASPEQADAALAEALRRLSPAAAAAEVARALKLPRRDLYARALALSGKGNKA
ncbi:MAG TPA: 16S rRNA (cytidine(1402)-2'-O)-methyltransferase [Caulobacteraceae bacterium]|jgi:16S rRNA (cytidine1402-2'-O)-methyltransferase|nr:16S rRNA (cytidine(1402)-2'-O)-methyltransferase [Caulobacteraceae bacterium]